MFHFARIAFFVVAWLALNAAFLPFWPWIARRMRSDPVMSRPREIRRITGGLADDGDGAQESWEARGAK